MLQSLAQNVLDAVVTFLLKFEGHQAPKGVLSQLLACKKLYSTQGGLAFRALLYICRANSVHSDVLSDAKSWGELAHAPNDNATRAMAVRFPPPGVILVLPAHMAVDWRALTRVQVNTFYDMLKRNQALSCAESIASIRNHIDAELRIAEELYRAAEKIKRDLRL